MLGSWDGIVVLLDEWCFWADDACRHWTLKGPDSDVVAFGFDTHVRGVGAYESLSMYRV